MSYTLSRQMQWVWGLTKGYRGGLALYLALELIAVFLSLSFVYWSKQAVDRALHVEGGDLVQALVYVVGSIALGIAAHLLAGWVSERTRLQLTMDLQERVMDSQMTSTWKFIKSWHTGDMMVRLGTDCTEVVQMIAYGGPNVVATLVRLIASFGFLWTMDPMLAWVILGVSPLFLFGKVYFRRVRQLNQDTKRAESEVGNVMQENLRFKMLIRGMGMMPFRRRKLREKQRDVFHLRMLQLKFSTFTQGVMRFVMNGAYLVAFTWGIYGLHLQQISFGTMTAFLQLVGRVQSPLVSIMSFFPAFVRFRTAVDRLVAVEETEREAEEPPILLKQPIAIHVKDLSFKYEEDTVIDSMNTVIRRGEPTAIVGSSGKGKTTFLRLLLSLIKPDAGEILLETEQGTSPLRVGHRPNFAYVPQGNTLFSGTIRENLMLENHAEQQERLERVLRMVCAEFVYSLPKGLDTVIGESGYGLSEGQAQRLSMARALLRESSIWVFDEATAALDQQTAMQVTERIIDGSKDKIVIFVTHDLKLAERCSKTVYME